MITESGQLLNLLVFSVGGSREACYRGEHATSCEIGSCAILHKYRYDTRLYNKAITMRTVYQFRLDIISAETTSERD